MLDKKRELNARLWLQATSRHIDQWLKFGLFGGAGSSHLQFGGFKTFLDGSIQGYTGAMKQGYFDRPQEHGKLVTDPAEFAASVLRYHSAGVPVAVHCNGDKAVEIAVQAFEAAQKACPRPELHHIIVHCQTASDAQLERMATIGVYPTLFPHHIYAYGDRHYARFLGPERAERLDPAGSCVRMGLPFGLHVDTPVFPPACLGSMHAAVNRLTSSGRLLGAGQRISVREALKAYTVYAARLCGCQKDRGMLAPGMFADFVALGENLEQARPETIRDIPVLATVCGGKIVYQNQ